MYLKGVKVSDCARFLGCSPATVRAKYKKLNSIIFSLGFFLDVKRFLDRHDEDDLIRHLQIMRGMLTHLGRKAEPPKDESEAFLRKEFEYITYHDGDGEYYPERSQLQACIETCETNTPPLAVRTMIDNGQIEEVRQRRASCKTCPLKIWEMFPYVSRSQRFPSRESDNRSIVYEPSYYPRTLNAMWVDVLWFLGHLRRHDKFPYSIKALHGVYFSILKQLEFKSSPNIANQLGTEIPTAFLYPEQKEAVKRGFRYVSMFDAPMAFFCLKNLRYYQGGKK